MSFKRRIRRSFGIVRTTVDIYMGGSLVWCDATELEVEYWLVVTAQGGG